MATEGTRFIVVITSQCIQVLNHYPVQLKLCYISIILQLKKKQAIINRMHATNEEV